ncbi:hypothetical protein COO60DRAFT_795617 [Scenedesmus sp. NREL 46B-D3]|nr:hypothetical protein COO60DRAFT_795617 [Scenedesmus sp. NREL 46B-D3]
MSGKGALLCLLALLAIVASQATAESNHITSVIPSGVPRRLLWGYYHTVTVDVMPQGHGSKTVAKAAPAPAPAPAKKEEVVVVMVPHHCKMWAKFGYIHPGCHYYYHAAGRKL